MLSLWYRLSDHWAVGAEAGEDTRGAVVYRPRVPDPDMEGRR